MYLKLTINELQKGGLKVLFIHHRVIKKNKSMVVCFLTLSIRKSRIKIKLISDDVVL